MATNTTNYGFKKPDESDFYDVADQNKNWDLADEALKNLDTPTFEDYTGSTAVPSATDAIDQIKSKGKLGTLLSNIKAAFKGACLIGHIVNNCVTDNAGLPLSAAQGKVLKDLYTQLYSDLSNGSVIANFSPMESNEANFCKGYDYDNGRFIFNFRGAVSKISDYVFSDGHQGIIAKLSELALKSETLTFRGIFEGNLNDAASWKIPAGIYQIKGKDTISNGPDGAQWCLFIQFPDDYHNQVMCIGGDNGVVTRRYIGSPQVWTSWT